METINREKGFTLIEMLIVLAVFSTIIGISYLALRPHYTLMEKNAFFSRLKADLLFAQNYSIVMQKYVTVNFYPSEHNYYVNFGDGNVLVRHYSEHIEVQPASMPLYFRFNSGGNINQFGSISVEINGQRYKMTFLIGRGRFYVVKE